ncbi:RNA polymerase sigma factor [Paenibacillus sp. Leaf72]|uniref:RNA polymerase sigma factor n=1 Tax=Paenibacillus sp. Leaf72 TaxID=1736234 RepID=UPI0006F21176|nr:sigma-70 family RNA polymerase sigma factor [Paenibacillus sp. Leaf72]KQN99867.1 hypothetical protein ASF12_16885 [Paenibacillus sp. Leaf72]
MTSKLLLLLSPDFSKLGSTIQEEVFKDFYHLTYGPIMYMVKDHSAAEDIIQEVFYKSISHTPQVQDERQLIAWIRVLVKNKTLNYLRKHKKIRNEVELESVFIETGAMQSPYSATVECEVEAKLLEEELITCMLEMKPEYRLLIELKWKRQFSYREIAEHLNSTEDIIRQKLYRARKALKDKWDKKRGAANGGRRK